MRALKWFGKKNTETVIELNSPVEYTCDGCAWKAAHRYQKCASCKRNVKMKDHWMPVVEEQSGDQEAVQNEG